MTAVLCIALLILCLNDYKYTGSTWGVVALHTTRILMILGLGTLALLSTGWMP